MCREEGGGLGAIALPHALLAKFFEAPALILRLFLNSKNITRAKTMLMRQSFYLGLALL